MSLQAGDIKVFQNAEKKSGGSSTDVFDSDSECDGDYDSDSSSEDGCSEGADLKAMRLNIVPAEEQWIEVEDGVRLQRCARRLYKSDCN